MSAYKTNLLKEWKSVETHLDFSEWVITRLEEEEQRNELFGDCLHRGLKLWQEANPDKDYWISGDANIKWMLDQIAALRERVAQLEGWKSAAEVYSIGYKSANQFVHSLPSSERLPFVSAKDIVVALCEYAANNRARVEALETLLKKTEFSQHDDVKDDYFCEFCSGYSETGHNDKCELAAALKGE